MDGFIALKMINEQHKVIENSRHWVTMDGAHVMVDGDGNVVSGAGGNLKGRQFKLIRSKSNDQQKYLPEPKEAEKSAKSIPNEKRQLSKKESKAKNQIAFDLKNFGYGEITKKNLQKEVDEYKKKKKEEEDKDNKVLKNYPNEILEYFEKENLHSDLIKSPEDVINNTKETFRLIGHGSNRWPPAQGEITRSSAEGKLNAILNVKTKRSNIEARGDLTAEDWENVKVDNDFVQAVKNSLAGKKETYKSPEENKTESTNKSENKNKKDIISKYGSGYWNQKVYGRKGNYSIYIAGKKKNISDKEANDLM